MLKKSARPRTVARDARDVRDRRDMKFEVLGSKFRKPRTSGLETSSGPPILVSDTVERVDHTDATDCLSLMHWRLKV